MFCNVDVFIIWFYEVVIWEIDDDMYDNILMGKINVNNCEYWKENLENELVVLKYLELKSIYINVIRFFVFN